MMSCNEACDTHVPLPRIARAAGLSDTAVRHIVPEGRERVKRQTAKLVAELDLANVCEETSGRLPSVGAVHRVQALMALRWRKADLEAEGVPSGQLVTRSRALIRIERWRQTHNLCERLSTEPDRGTAWS